jgi:hypothetical protein
VTDSKAEPLVTISAVVTRADGTVEDLGIVATNVNTATPLKAKLLTLLTKREN